MSFFPDIDENGSLKEPPKEKKLYKPPTRIGIQKEEERLAELNNLNHKEITEDFSDSPFLEK